MKNKKLSLGDIIRKVNDDRAAAGNADAPADIVRSPQNPELPHSAPLPLMPEAPRSVHTEPSQKPAAPIHRHENTGKSKAEEEPEFDLFRYVGIILRRRLVIATVTVLMTIFSIFQYFSAEKYYTSHARLLFKPEEKQLLDNQFGYSGGDRIKTFNTHLELLRSNTVLNMVSDNLDGKISAGDILDYLTIAQGVTNKEKNDIIELTFRNRDPNLTQDVLNELCKTYIEYRLGVNTQEVSRLLHKFEVQISKLQTELDRKESGLRKFKEDNRMVELSDETNLTVSKISQMELSLQETQLALIDSRERLTSLKSQIGAQDLDIVQSITLTDPLKNKIAALELEYNSLSSEYSAEHFKVKMIRQQIEKLKSATADSISRAADSRTLVKNPIRQSLLQEYISTTIERSANEAKRIALEQIIDQLNKDLFKLPSLEQNYAFLQRETESILATLRMLKTKYEETKIRRDSQETDIKILELAELPDAAASSVKPISILIGILLGFFFGVAIALLIEHLDQSVKDPSEVERTLNLPLLGIVPLIETDTALVQKPSDQSKSILEPFRALRANLKHVISTNGYKTLMICSAVKGEGKTTLSANLGITFALDGKRVILIDADLRRSQIHNLFSTQKETGLSDYLLGTKSVDEIIKKTVFPNLSIITSGERPHNPAELVGTSRFDLLIKELKERADLIIFDSPALLPVSDGMTMAPKADCCIMIVRTTWTPIKASKQATLQLTRLGCNLIGGIFNGVTKSRAYYPYYYGYYGYYSYTKYTYDDEPEKKFSLRQFGLDLESKFKQRVQSVRYALPKYFAATAGVFRALFRKKTFRILLLLFFILAGTSLWLHLKPSARSRNTESIAYLGISGTGQEESYPDSVHSPMKKLPADSQEDTARARQVIGPAELRDNLYLWFNARTTKNLPAYIALYDSLTFTSATGSFAGWKMRVQTLFDSSKTAPFILDSVWLGISRPDYIETLVRLKPNSGTDTMSTVNSLIWRKGTDGWKIVAETPTK
ncbi:MAG: polysaccharide biosynthesis tyrosine autokinase [Chitinispirillaceae bacterium]|jgi:capsular exopolysaccharide synthesis family protein|nr:polysaccharide biosynthesis tyrosine autokinase [Chitinispirillaceae bacterium]